MLPEQTWNYHGKKTLQGIHEELIPSFFPLWLTLFSPTENRFSLPTGAVGSRIPTFHLQGVPESPRGSRGRIPKDFFSGAEAGKHWAVIKY